MGRKSNKNSINKKSNDANEVSNKAVNKHRSEINNLVDKLLGISTVMPTTITALKAWELHSEIEEILKKIKILEFQTSIVENRTPENFRKFEKFMKEKGANFKNIEISKFQSYEYGLKTNEIIKKGTLIISVPRKLMLSIENAKISSLNILISEDTMLQHMPNITLALFLLLEKFDSQSFWKPYIDILPTKYSTVLYFTSEELTELKGSPTMDAALKQCRNIARQFAYLNKLFRSSDTLAAKKLKENFTYEEYRWAVSTVMTRQNSIPAQDGSCMIPALIPLWDMCNHTNGNVSSDFNTKLDQCECEALEECKPGDQLFIFYGIRTNAEMFIHNGFVYPNNEYDGYWLKLGISQSDKLFEKRKNILEKIGLPTQKEFWIRPGPEPFDGMLVAFLKVFNMNELQLQNWSQTDTLCDLENIDSVSDLNLITRMWNFLKVRLTLILKSYPTSLTEDLELLKNDFNVTPNKKLAIEMRVTEKKILHGALNNIEQRLKKLN